MNNKCDYYFGNNIPLFNTMKIARTAIKNIIEIISKLFTILSLVPKANGIGPIITTPPISDFLSVFLSLVNKVEINISSIPINIMMMARTNNTRIHIMLAITKSKFHYQLLLSLLIIIDITLIKNKENLKTLRGRLS